MQWTWLILFLATAGVGVFILRACPNKTSVAESSPTPIVAPIIETAPITPPPPASADRLRGNGPLSSTGAPKAPDNNPSYPGNSPVPPPPPPGYDPGQNYTPPVYQPPPNYQPPTYSEPGFDPNSVPPPPPPPPPSMDGEFDGNNIPPPAFEPPEEMNDPNFSQPYNPED